MVPSAWPGWGSHEIHGMDTYSCPRTGRCFPLKMLGGWQIPPCPRKPRSDADQRCKSCTRCNAFRGMEEGRAGLLRVCQAPFPRTGPFTPHITLRGRPVGWPSLSPFPPRHIAGRHFLASFAVWWNHVLNSGHGTCVEVVDATPRAGS